MTASRCRAFRRFRLPVASRTATRQIRVWPPPAQPVRLALLPQLRATIRLQAQLIRAAALSRLQDRRHKLLLPAARPRAAPLLTSRPPRNLRAVPRALLLL